MHVKIYPHIYPLWGIVFLYIIDYTDSVEVLLIGVTADQLAIIYRTQFNHLSHSPAKSYRA